MNLGKIVGLPSLRAPFGLSRLVRVSDRADLLEQVLKASRKKSLVLRLSLYRMSLPRTSLPISEYRPVVALQALIDNRLPHYLKDLMLGGCLASDVIKGEGRSIDSLVRHKRNLLVPYLSNAFISEIRACKSPVQAL